MTTRPARRLVPAAAALCLTLVTAACGGSSPAGDASATPSAGAPSSTPSGASGSPSPTASSSVVVADPEHAVDPPGPRDGPLLPADLLVFSAEPLADEVVEQIEALDKVTGVEPISMAQVSVENQVLDLVAVDPGAYRHFTPLQSADFQEVWDRVAGGEVALTPEQRRLLKPDRDGFVKLGSEEDAPRVHVGAYAPQIEGLVDAVVNEKWGESMGMPEGNALIVSTTVTAPDRVVAPIEKIVGTGVSVQRLDAVARYGLDIKATQTAVVVGSVQDVVGHFTYTVIGGGRIAPDPAWVAEHIATEQVPILGRVTCNKAMLPQLRAALQEIVDLGLAHEIRPNDYAGCYYPRFIANTTTLSNHSFGTAFDINVSTNGRGIKGDMHPLVVSTFKKWGFAWGGDWNWTDPMHFEMNRLVTPGG